MVKRAARKGEHLGNSMKPIWPPRGWLGISVFQGLFTKARSLYTSTTCTARRMLPHRRGLKIQPSLEEDKVDQDTQRAKKSEISLPSLRRASDTSVQDRKSLCLVDVVAIRRRGAPSVGKGAVDGIGCSAGSGSRSQEDGLEAHDVGWGCQVVAGYA